MKKMMGIIVIKDQLLIVCILGNITKVCIIRKNIVVKFTSDSVFQKCIK